MRIAAAYEAGNVFQHFGRTEAFKLYDVEDGQIVRERIVRADGFGHGALAGFLREQGVDKLICGGIGGGARQALDVAGIEIYGGVSGSADEAARSLAAGELAFDPGASCDHHGKHHHGEEHACGQGCGNNSCH